MERHASVTTSFISSDVTKLPPFAKTLNDTLYNPEEFVFNSNYRQPCDEFGELHNGWLIMELMLLT